MQTVVMESTGVYWIPLFGVLEERGFEVMLVDPRRIKNVPGRKTDVLDCQWLQQLHTYGLLSGAFRPDGDIRRLRSYLRQRAMLVEYASHHIQHMQKALTQMNVKLQLSMAEACWTTVAERKCTTKGHRPAQGSAPIVQGECRPDSRSGRQGGELGRVLGRPMRRLEAGNQRSPCYA